MTMETPFESVVLDVLNHVSGLTGFPDGAFNIRLNGTSVGKQSTPGVSITPKAGVSGIEVHVQPGVKETIHIPVVISESGVQELVYNDFFIGEGAQVTIVAGCGIHNCGALRSQHDGIHSFYVGKNAKVSYFEKHYGAGEGTGEKILNPITKCYLSESSSMEMDTVQIEGVDSTKRETYGKLEKDASFVVREKIMTHGKQHAETIFDVDHNGENSSSHLISRSVATGDSYQVFLSKINGNTKCHGHSECDAILSDRGVVKAMPEITAYHIDAELIHEATIGKIAGEQLVKLMTLGLTEKEAETQILNGFLK
jgi:ABC-type transport system involved in Fe-S cluster assembly, permease component